MKKGLYLLLVVGLAVAWTGCKSEKAAPAPASTPASSTEVSSSDSATPEDSTTSEFTLVTLKVPNMTWGGCAASVRSDLVKIEGVEDIETDTVNRTCSFKLTKPDVDYKAKLAEYAQTNTHLAGYEIM